jgi:hypothetical protein
MTWQAFRALPPLFFGSTETNQMRKRLSLGGVRGVLLCALCPPFAPVCAPPKFLFSLLFLIRGSFFLKKRRKEYKKREKREKSDHKKQKIKRRSFENGSAPAPKRYNIYKNQLVKQGTLFMPQLLNAP